jgi:4-amino-4-deoxy-L-arabinose transferase-like glycosyltransferase
MKSLLGKYSNSSMTLVMLGIFVVMVAIASRYPAEARFMPFVVGIPPILLCLLQLVLDARARHRPPADAPSDIERAQATASQIVGHQVEFGASGTTEPQLSPAETVHRELVLWGYFLGFIAGIVLFGFWVAIPLFLVSFLRLQAKAGWRTALLLGVGASVALFLVFERGLKVQVHSGFVTSFVLDHLSR